MKSFFQTDSKRSKIVCALLYSVIYLKWFGYLEDRVTPDCSIMHIPLDDLIPFNELFVIPYLLWFVYIAWGLIYSGMKNSAAFWRLGIMLAAGMSLSLLTFTIFPNSTLSRPRPDVTENFCGWLVGIIQRVDTNTNVFPSIHVLNAYTVWHVMVKEGYFKWTALQRFGLGLLTVLICMSTVFLKQHSLLDIAGAFIIYEIVVLLWDGIENRIAHRRDVPGRQRSQGLIQIDR